MPGWISTMWPDMTPSTVAVIVLLLPTVAWLLAILVLRLRMARARRAGAEGARARLHHTLGRARARGHEVEVIPTWAVDLPGEEVVRRAADDGYELVGFEWSRGPLRRRVGVFLRSEGEVARLVAGTGRRTRTMRN